MQVYNFPKLFNGFEVRGNEDALKDFKILSIITFIACNLVAFPVCVCGIIIVLKTKYLI